MATSRARVAEPQTRQQERGNLTEEGVKSMTVGYIRGKLGVAAIKAQCLTLFGQHGACCCDSSWEEKESSGPGKNLGQ